MQLILRTTLSCDYARFTDQETELWEAWYLVQGLTVKKVGEPGVSALTTGPPCPTGMRNALMCGRLGVGGTGMVNVRSAWGRAHPIMQPAWPMRKGSTLPPWRKQTSCGSPAGAPTVPPGQLFPPSLSLLLLPLPSEKLTGVKLDVEEIALTAASQRRKLAVVLEAAGQSLQVEESQARWSVESAWGWCQGGWGGRAPAFYSGCGGCCLEAQNKGDKTQPCP